MLKNDLPADDTLWNYLAQKENYRLLVYKALKEISCLNKLSDTLITQENMAKATIYKNQKASDRDTIEFLARKEATINGQTGYIYFFKRKKNYGTNNWFVDYSGPHPLDTATFNQIPLFANKGTDLDMYDDINEQLEKILVAMKNKQRRRYSDSSSNGEYNYYDYEEDAIEMDYDE